MAREGLNVIGKNWRVVGVTVCWNDNSCKSLKDLYECTTLIELLISHKTGKAKQIFVVIFSSSWEEVKVKT